MPDFDERVRLFMEKYPEFTEEVVRDALLKADRWVGTRRYSATIVAHNFLVDGRLHP